MSHSDCYGFFYKNSKIDYFYTKINTNTYLKNVQKTAQDHYHENSTATKHCAKPTVIADKTHWSRHFYQTLPARRPISSALVSPYLNTGTNEVERYNQQAQVVGKSVQ